MFGQFHPHILRSNNNNNDHHYREAPEPVLLEEADFGEADPPLGEAPEPVLLEEAPEPVLLEEATDVISDGEAIAVRWSPPQNPPQNFDRSKVSSQNQAFDRSKATTGSTAVDRSTATQQEEEAVDRSTATQQEEEAVDRSTATTATAAVDRSTATATTATAAVDRSTATAASSRFMTQGSDSDSSISEPPTPTQRLLQFGALFVDTVAPRVAPRNDTEEEQEEEEEEEEGTMADTDVPAPTPAPAGEPAVPTIAEMMQIILSLQTQNSSLQADLQTQNSSLQAQVSSRSSKTQLVKPRLGGITTTGVWTGTGKGPTGRRAPAGKDCMRAFDADVIKNHQSMAPIEDRCKQGLRDSPELLFCMPTESNSDTIVSSIRAFDDHLTLCGMDGVFQISLTTPSGFTTINMLQYPAKVTAAMIDTWCTDLLETGVLLEDGSRHATCTHDATNLLWSGDAVLNSCTEKLRQQLKLVIPPDDRYGPKVLMLIFQKLYRPSVAKNQVLLDKLLAMDIRKYAAENVTLFVQDAKEVVHELMMNIPSPSVMPQLTQTALSGLTNSSDPYFLLEVRKLRLACDTEGYGYLDVERPDALSTLEDLDALYVRLVNSKNYTSGPTGHYL